MNNYFRSTLVNEIVKLPETPLTYTRVSKTIVHVESLVGESSGTGTKAILKVILKLKIAYCFQI